MSGVTLSSHCWKMTQVPHTQPATGRRGMRLAAFVPNGSARGTRYTEASSHTALRRSIRRSGTRRSAKGVRLPTMQCSSSTRMDVCTLQGAHRRSDVGAVRCVRHCPVQHIETSAVLPAIKDASYSLLQTCWDVTVRARSPCLTTQHSTEHFFCLFQVLQ